MILDFKIILGILVHVLIDLNMKPSMTLNGQTSLFRKSLSYPISGKSRSIGFGKMANRNFTEPEKNRLEFRSTKMEILINQNVQF